MGLKMSEILLIMAALLLLFGATRLPQLGSSLGQAIRNFKRGFSQEEETAASDPKSPAHLAGQGTASSNSPRETAPVKPATKET
ncbi:MAG TPA: twin-arginine translocase TatA/TatE family subunit [Myxococcaceae bacterium]|nr:twin-arginine translocase TatA/TatE family subunit [Myxococcaceae bacterium]